MTEQTSNPGDVGASTGAETQKSPLVQGDTATAHGAVQLESLGLVDGPRLMELLFPDQRCRPSLRWLRELTLAGGIPHIRLGRLIFYRPTVVMNSLQEVVCG